MNESAVPVSVTPQTMPRVATVDGRFQSYNIEMAEVIGADFWNPYPKGRLAKAARIILSAIGRRPAIVAARPPIDLASRRLRTLAAALGPAYVRVSGTWANPVYFQNDAAAPRAAPPGFEGVLTRAQWAGVIDFARAVNAKVVTSFAISAGVRDAAGDWTPDQARRLVAFTRSIGGEIAAAELFNEPTLAASNGAPAGYDASRFARDEAAFRAFVKSAAPGMSIVGPASLGEGGVAIVPASVPMLKSQDLLAAEPQPQFDIFSYHFYGAVSQRCEGMGPGVGTTPADALSEAWLSRTAGMFDFYKPLQARYAPDAPIWLDETAETACGGNPWAATFLDSFRYLDQMGRLAKRGVKAIFHNTLAASDYGLLDQDDFEPRPNYWAALLWHRLMGPVVLDAGSASGGLHLYAQCLPGHPGGVTLLAINTSRTRAASLTVPVAVERYTLSAHPLESAAVQLNGRPLRLQDDDGLPPIVAQDEPAGLIDLGPASLTFLAMPGAANESCRD